MEVNRREINILFRALRASMRVVACHQIAGGREESVAKGDGTLVTRVDKESEAAAIRELRTLPGVLVNAEERGRIGFEGSNLEILLDPLDGTRPFVNGAVSSTVIVAAYDRVLKEVVICLVGEPATGRIWQTHAGQGAWRQVIGHKTFDGLQVWPGKLGPKATVYLDLYPGFKGNGSSGQCLTDSECARLFTSLYAGTCAVNMLGSNGVHHALVANGGEGVAGAITTAIGGPWDVAPALLVLEAGGDARAFAIGDDGKLEERNPLDVTSYHLLVTGNSQETVNILSGKLLALR